MTKRRLAKAKIMQDEVPGLPDGWAFTGHYWTEESRRWNCVILKFEGPVNGQAACVESPSPWPGPSAGEDPSPWHARGVREEVECMQEIARSRASWLSYATNWELSA